MGEEGEGSPAAVGAGRAPLMASVRGGRLDIVLMVVGATVLLATALLAERGVYGWEVAIFQAVNGLPGSLRPLLWVLNQYGTAITIPVATVVALAFRRWVLAAALAMSGVTVYVLAKVIKGYVDRGRPSALVESVVEREPFSPESLGYQSGHAAVAWGDHDHRVGLHGTSLAKGRDRSGDRGPGRPDVRGGPLAA